jgi:hypothetical protein
LAACFTGHVAMFQSLDAHRTESDARALVKQRETEKPERKSAQMRLPGNA